MNQERFPTPAEAFAPRLKPGKPNYEVWFTVQIHPQTQRALWLRYMRMLPKPAAGKTPSHVLWASFFDANAPEKHVYVTCELPPDFFEAAAAARGAPCVAPDRVAGSVETARGELRWDLAFDGQRGVFDPLPKWLTRLPVGGTKDIILEPRVHSRGTVSLNGEAMSFDGARGTLHHMWGTKQALEIYWMLIPAFDDDHEGWSMEIVSVKPDAASPFMAWAVLNGPDGLRSSASLWRMLRSRCTPDYPNFSFDIRGADFSVQVDARMPPGQVTGYRFRDPDGRSLYCEQSDVCAADVVLTDRGNVRRLKTARGAAMEFHGIKPWSKVSYLDPYGKLFK